MTPNEQPDKLLAKEAHRARDETPKSDSRTQTPSGDRSVDSHSHPRAHPSRQIDPNGHPEDLPLPPTGLKATVSAILAEDAHPGMPVDAGTGRTLEEATPPQQGTEDHAPRGLLRRKLAQPLIAMNRLSLLLRNHPFRYAFGASISEMARSLFNPAATMSYSQTGEDRIIHHLLDMSKPGFYVDVGCNHPLRKSNTLRLYQRGWKGLCVDGNPDLVSLFKRMRPKDQTVCAVVSDEEKEMEFLVAKDDAVSTVSQQHADEWIGDEGVEKRIQTKSKTLTKLLDEHQVPKEFELLSVDVEGHDAEVIRSLDFHRYRPQIVLCEIHGFDLLHPDQFEIYRYLTAAGYRLVGYAAFNAFFVRAE